MADRKSSCPPQEASPPDSDSRYCSMDPFQHPTGWESPPKDGSGSAAKGALCVRVPKVWNRVRQYDFVCVCAGEVDQVFSMD